MKKILISSLIVILIIVFTISNGFSSQSQQEVIKNINSIYNKYPTIKSKFKQIDALGKTSYGWFIIDKKNSKARIEYTSIPLRIIANNNSVMLEQIDLQEKTFSPLAASPFKYIINKDATLDNPSLIISNFVNTTNGYNITINSKQDNFKGVITLSFNKKFYLVGWSIIDEIGNTTNVTLINPSYSSNKISSNIFNTHRVINLNFNDIK